METFEVYCMVNNIRNDVPECIEPVDINPRLFSWTCEIDSGYRAPSRKDQGMNVRIKYCDS